MITVAEIKAAIDQLSPEERCELEMLLHPPEYDDWDRQMIRDAEAGKFDAMIPASKAADAAGLTIPLEDILRGIPPPNDEW